MKKIFIGLLAMLFIITGCGLSEEDYNKKIESSITKVEKLTEDASKDISLGGSSTFYKEISVILDEVSKLEFSGDDLKTVNSHFTIKSKMYNDMGTLFAEYDKKNNGVPVEEMDSKLIEEMSTEFNKAVEKYGEDLSKSKEEAQKSLDKLKKDKKISKETYVLVSELIKVTN